MSDPKSRAFQRIMNGLMKNARTYAFRFKPRGMEPTEYIRSVEAKKLSRAYFDGAKIGYFNGRNDERDSETFKIKKMVKMRLTEKHLIFLLNYMREKDGEFLEFVADENLQEIIDCFCVEENAAQ